MKEYIERRNLIETYCKDNCGNRRCRDAWDKCTFISYVLEEPTADVREVIHAKWINAYPDIEPNQMFMYGICSNCKFEQSISIDLKYCPECGAKMDLEW